MVGSDRIVCQWMGGNVAGKGSLWPKNPSPHPSKKAILDENDLF